MIYDYRSDETVQDNIFKDINDLVDDVIDEFFHLHRDQVILIYTPAYYGKEIIRQFRNEFKNAYFHKESCNELLELDDNEVLITIGHDGFMFIEEARGFKNNLIRTDGSSLAYVYDGFSKRDIDELSMDGDSILVFGFDNDTFGLDSYDYDDYDNEDSDDYCDGDCDNCRKFPGYYINGRQVDKDEFEDYKTNFIRRKNDETVKVDKSDKNVIRKPTTKSTYRVNGKEVDKDTFESALADIEDRCLDNVRDMLLGYCEIMDEMNDWKSRFLRW